MIKQDATATSLCRGLRRWQVLLMVCLFGAFAANSLQAQKVAIKTNLVPYAVVAPNLSLEMAMSQKWTMDLSYGTNFFMYQNKAKAPNYKTKKLSHWLAQAEARYWFCESFNGLFLGLHAQGGQANVGGYSIPFILENKNNVMKDHRYEAYFYGAGVGVGYHWAIAPRFGLEFELGAGYNRIHYTKFPCAECGTEIGKGVANYVGPTKAAVTLVFMLK